MNGENFGKQIIKEVIKEIEVIKKIPLDKFDKNKLIINSNINIKTRNY